MIPLSYPQRGLWFLNQLDPEDTSYHVRLVWRFAGVLDEGALHEALRDTVARHESLRTAFPEKDGLPEQRVMALEDLGALLVVTHTTLEEADEAEELLASRAFALSKDTPLRAELLRTGPDHGLLALVVHHVAFDGWSEPIFCRDLSSAYAARAAGQAPQWPELPVQYADYALWQHDLLAGENDPDSLLSQQLAYWQAQLSGMPQESGLTSGRRTDGPGVSRTVTFRVDALTHLGLVALAQRAGVTMLMVVHTALAVAVTAIGGESDLPLGTVVSGRSDEALSELVGYFCNTVVLRTDTSGNPTFVELLRRARDVDLAAFANQDVPFEKVVASVRPARLRFGSPLVQILFSIEEHVAPALVADGVIFEYQPRDGTAAKFDLSVVFAEEFDGRGEPTGITGMAEFRPEVFEPGVIDALTRAMASSMEMMVADPDARIGGLAPADKPETHPDAHPAGRPPQ